MFYKAFFLFCIAVVVLVVLTFKCRYRALALGLVGLAGGSMLEFYGVSSYSWDYSEVDSLLRVLDVPVEILFGYFTGAFFLMVLVEHLPDIGERAGREAVLRVSLLIIGVGLLVLTFTSFAVPFVVGWAFLGVFGLSIARDRSVPVTVGLAAFILDWAVEGLLTAYTEYYPGGWNPSIGLVFMFVSMFLAGLLTEREMIMDQLGALVKPGGNA